MEEKPQLGSTLTSAKKAHAGSRFIQKQGKMKLLLETSSKAGQ
jgi:hypothetical protein